MAKGLSHGDSVLLNGRRVDFNREDFIHNEDGFTDRILHGGGYSASTILLDISCDAGRYGLVSELKRVRKVGNLKGVTVASYVERYLDGDYEEYKEGD